MQPYLKRYTVDLHIKLSLLRRSLLITDEERVIRSFLSFFVSQLQIKSVCKTFRTVQMSLFYNKTCNKICFDANVSRRRKRGGWGEEENSLLPLGS